MIEQRTSIDALLGGLVGAGASLEALVAYLGMTAQLIIEHVVRLDLPTPASAPLRTRSSNAWSIDDIQRLIAWRHAGVHPEVIGPSLLRSRSANAVRAKSRRLGVPAPPRNALFRPTADQLTLPLGQLIDDAPAPMRGASRPVASCDRAPASLRATPLLPGFVPTRIEQLDFDDLTWIGRLPGRRISPNNSADGISTNLAAVHAVGIVTCAGVDRFTAAALLGMDEPAYRTLRTRLGIPPIANREAFCNTFDRQIGEETIRRNGLEVVASIKREDGRPPHLFWRFANERQVRKAPCERERRRRGDTSIFKPMTVVTRAILDAEVRTNLRSLAQQVSTVAAPVAKLNITPPRPPSTRTPQPPTHAFPSAAFATTRASLHS